MHAKKLLVFGFAVDGHCSPIMPCTKETVNLKMKSKWLWMMMKQLQEHLQKTKDNSAGGGFLKPQFDCLYTVHEFNNFC